MAPDLMAPTMVVVGADRLLDGTPERQVGATADGEVLNLAE